MEVANDDQWLPVQELKGELRKRAPLSDRELNELLGSGVKGGNLNIRYAGSDDEFSWEQVRGRYGYVDSRTGMDRDAESPRPNPLARCRGGETSNDGGIRRLSPIKAFFNDPLALLNLRMVMLFIERHDGVIFRPGCIGSETVPPLGSVERNQGGAPALWDWERAKIEAIRRFDDTFSPTDVTVEKIAHFIADWLTQKAGSGGERARVDQAKPYAEEVWNALKRDFDDAPSRLPNMRRRRKNK